MLVPGSVLPSRLPQAALCSVHTPFKPLLSAFTSPQNQWLINPRWLWTAWALQHFDVHCLLFSYSGNVMKNHNKTRKTHHIWPLLDDLIKPAWYTNMKEQLLVRPELLLPCPRTGNSSEALLTIRCLHLQQSLSLRPKPNVKLLVSPHSALLSALTQVSLLMLYTIMVSVLLMSLQLSMVFFSQSQFYLHKHFSPHSYAFIIVISSVYSCKNLALKEWLLQVFCTLNPWYFIILQFRNRKNVFGATLVWVSPRSVPE